MSLSTYCGSFSQRGFKQHVRQCRVCWIDAQGRSDLDFDPSDIANPSLNPSTRTFHQAIYSVEVLSETQIGNLSLTEIATQIRQGDCSGTVTKVRGHAIDAKTAARLLTKQGSDSGFFGLDKFGNDARE